MIKETIQLGTQTPQFAYPTLILEVNKAQARLFLGHGTQVDVLDAISPDITSEYSDNEGHSNHGNSAHGGSTHGTSSTEENHHVKDHITKVHTNQIIEKVKFLDGNQKFKSLHIFLTTDFKKEFEEKIPKHIMEKTKFHTGNFSHSTIHDLISAHR